MTIKITGKGILREKLGGCGVGRGLCFPAPIEDSEGAFTMVSRIELEPGASIGYHTHCDNEEVYTIMSGTGLYTEDGEEAEARAGDVFLCKKGSSHGLVNTGSEALVISAAIARR